MTFFMKNTLALVAVALLFGSASMGWAETIEGARLYAQAGPPTSFVQEAGRSQRELAALQADMRVLQEDQKMLLARILGLEHDLQSRDERIRELQKLLAANDKRFEALEREWHERFDALKQALEQERNSRNQELQSLGKAMAAEIVRVEKSATARPAAAYTGKYKELVVQRGDTLSGISSLAGVSIESIREANGLKDDLIRVGQVLKIPTK